VLLTRSWGAVILATFMYSIESITVELLFGISKVPTLTIAATSIPIAGALLLVANRVILKRNIGITSNAWKPLLIGSICTAIAEFTWYDSVSRIGAGRSGLLSVPIETVLIVIFAYVFLSERLHEVQVIGIIAAVIGFFLSAAIDATSVVSIAFGIGEAEALIFALSGATAITLYTNLVAKYRSLEVAGLSLLISGLILATVHWLFFQPQIMTYDWYRLIAFSIVPLLAVLLFTMSLNKIGASLTSTIASSTMILTVAVDPG
jgi:drug/metabolite transporter (DMT)-like permease